MVTSDASPTANARTVLRICGEVVLCALMLLAVLALWNTSGPQFIYVAF
jgi:hypothetical protein